MSTIHHVLPHGTIEARGDNEEVMRSTIADPCKARFAVPENLVESNLGCNSYDTARPDGELDERVTAGGRLLEDGSGAYFIAIADAKGQPVREVLLVSRHGLSGPAAQRQVTRFYTDGGKFCVNWQDDTGQPSGIVYATHGSPNEATWTAVGRVRIDPL